MMSDVVIIGLLWIIGIVMFFTFCYCLLRLLYLIVGSIFADDMSAFFERHKWDSPPVYKTNPWLW